jgi:hypothetical protein
MSRQLRYRVTAIVLGGLVFGAPLLANGTAHAEQVSDGGRQVTFDGGGMFGLSCESRPDVESMVVPAESTVRVVNNTGFTARLQLGGETKGLLPDDESTEVVFRRGTTEVLLKPNCALGEDATPVLVTAAPSAPATMPDPIPAPSGGDSPAPTAAQTGAGEPSGQAATGTTLPDSAPAVGRPSWISPAVGQPGSRGPGAPRTTAVVRSATGSSRAVRQSVAATQTKIKNKTSAGTGRSATPAFAGMPPGDEKQLVAGVPRLDAAPATTDAQPETLAEPTDVAAAEPVAAMAPIRETGPVGLLGLIAAVCVMGVGAAAIRAIVSQRANRAKMA